MSELSEIKSLLERIDSRLQHLEDIEAINRLIVDYARGADQGNDPELLTPLFTEDAIWEAKGFGRWEGRDKVIGFLKAIAGEKVWWSLHFMISPKIDIAPDGKSATLIWYLWEPATMPDEETKEALLFNEEANPAVVTEVTEKGYASDLDEAEQEEVGRDPFLIAYGYADVGGYFIVTFEISAPSKQRANRKIPDICKELGIDCGTLFDVIEALDFTTDWKPE